MIQEHLSTSRTRGFTLVELLTVLGVIGILATMMIVAFGGVRKQARDDRRVADLFQAQQALQLFYNKCGFYPGRYVTVDDTGAGFAGGTGCRGGTWSPSGSGPSGPHDTVNPTSWPGASPFNWGNLSISLTDALRVAEISIPSIPNDPIRGRTYEYRVQLGDTSASFDTPRAQCYVLRARMETNHRSLGNDLDNNQLLTKLLPLSILPACSSGVGDPGCKRLYPNIITVGLPLDCDDSGFNYCAGNIECFYGS